MLSFMVYLRHAALAGKNCFAFVRSHALTPLRHAADLAVAGRHRTHGAGVNMIVQYDLLGQLVNKPRKAHRERIGSKAFGAVTAQHDARSNGLFTGATRNRTRTAKKPVRM